MIHARPDYQRIQDPAGLIPAAEPVFLLRAQDKTAPDAVEAWARLQYSGDGNRDLASTAMEHATRMREWQTNNGSKTADGPHPIASTTNDAQEALAERLYVLADRHAKVVYYDAARAAVTEPWQQCPDQVHRFYRAMAGALLRGEQ